jgi:hypothetical protein
MATKNNFFMFLFCGENTNAPFVKVEYLDQEANAHTALMIIDSGSDVNLLFQKMMGTMCWKGIENKGKHFLNGIGGEWEEVEDVELNFTLDSLLCKEIFCVKDIDYPQYMKYPVIGIIGTPFLCKYELALDYSDYSLHTSRVSTGQLPLHACEYFLPMNLEACGFHLPLLSLQLNGKEIVAVADSGSTANIVAEPSLRDSSVPFSFLGDGGKTVGVNGEIKTTQGEVPFSIISTSEDGKKEMKKAALFKIYHDYISTSTFIDEHSKSTKVQTIDALLSSPFMASQGWVLDFGANIIYKQKSIFQLDQNIAAV